MAHMFRFASEFNQPLNAWNVSSATDMKGMFRGSSFDQDLGNWYIILGDVTVERGDTTVTTITAQNSFLDQQNPVYSVAAGGDGDLFEIRGNVLRSMSGEYAKSSYDITIVSTGDFTPLISRNVTITVIEPS